VDRIEEIRGFAAVADARSFSQAAGAQACLAAARAGFGIARAPAFAAVDDLRAGRLKSLLCEFEPEPLPIHVVYPQTRHLAAKVRAFVDFLAQRFAGEPEWHRGWS
jgi:DNA-binding transcriptional LysR family regulator